jgi:hypothetical protein
MSSKKYSKSTEASLAKQLIAGIGKHLTNVASVTLNGVSMTPAQVAASLQTLANLRSDAEAAKATAKAKVANENALAPALHSLLTAFVAVVKAGYGTQPDVLADFGVSPKKVRAPMTAEQRALANAKREATREARGTKGPKQKAAVKGKVTGVVITPVVAPEAAAAPVATAPSAGNSGGSTSGGNVKGA